MSHEVIMPQLGMSQDSAVIVSWCKSAGDSVAKGDVLFEVETDKAVMEVEARHDGFLTAILAEPQQDIPVGQVIAIIGSDAADTHTGTEAAAAPAQNADSTSTAPVADRPESLVAPAAAAAPAAHSAVGSGRVLASPKAKRLAQERGIDLSQLLQQGASEPLHAADIPLTAAPKVSAQNAGCAQLQAKCKRQKIDEFLQWCADTGPEKVEPAQLWASFCAAAMADASAERAVVVRVSELQNQDSCWSVSGRSLQQATALENPTHCDVHVMDFSGSCIDGYTPADSGLTPTLVITGASDDCTLSLHYQPSQFSLQQAAQWLQAIALRCQYPLYHLF